MAGKGVLASLQVIYFLPRDTSWNKYRETAILYPCYLCEESTNLLRKTVQYMPLITEIRTIQS